MYFDFFLNVEAFELAQKSNLFEMKGKKLCLNWLNTSCQRNIKCCFLFLNYVLKFVLTGKIGIHFYFFPNDIRQISLILL